MSISQFILLMTKSSLLFPTFLGASLMFGTTYLIKYGINTIQEPLSNVLVYVTTVINTEEYLNLLLPSVGYGLFCNIKNFLSNYSNTVPGTKEMEEKFNNNTVSNRKGETVNVDKVTDSSKTSVDLKSNVKEAETTKSSLYIENTPSSMDVKDSKIRKGKQKTIEPVTNEVEENVITTVAESISKQEISPTISENNTISSTISKSNRTSEGGVLPYIKSNTDLVHGTSRGVKIDILKPINTSNNPFRSNTFMAPLSFHPSAATSLGITSSGSKIKLQNTVNNPELHLAGKNFFLTNKLKVKETELHNAETRVVNLQSSLMDEVQKNSELKSEYNQLFDNFQKQSKILNANLLHSLSQFQYSSFSSLVAKLGMFFSTTVDILYSTSLNTIVGLSIYGITQFTTTFYSRKLAAGIVSTLYSTVFNRITKIVSIGIIKYSSYVGVAVTSLIIAVSSVLSMVSFSLNAIPGIGNIISIKTTTSEWFIRIVNMLIKIGLFISQIEPFIKYISCNKSYFFYKSIWRYS